MSNENMPNEVKLALIPIGSLALVCCVVFAVVGGLISVQRGGVLGDGLMSMIATIPGVLIPLAILRMMPAKLPGQWGVPVIGGTMIRALFVMSIGIVIFLVADPARVVFFLTLLAVLMTTLLIDVVSVLQLIQKHTIGMTPMGDAEGIS